MLHNVKVEVYGEVPACLDGLCPFYRDCANHITAGEWREACGLTPNLREVVPGSWRCNQNPTEPNGPIAIDGTYFNEIEE